MAPQLNCVFEEGVGISWNLSETSAELILFQSHQCVYDIKSPSYFIFSPTFKCVFILDHSSAEWSLQSTKQTSKMAWQWNMQQRCWNGIKSYFANNLCPIPEFLFVPITLQYLTCHACKLIVTCTQKNNVTAYDPPPLFCEQLCASLQIDTNSMH